MCCYRSRLVFNLLLRHDVSQGSVATHLRCGWIFSDDIIAKFILICQRSKFENRLIFDNVTRHTKIDCAIFGATLYIRRRLGCRRAGCGVDGWWRRGWEWPVGLLQMLDYYWHRYSPGKRSWKGLVRQADKRPWKDEDAAEIRDRISMSSARPRVRRDILVVCCSHTSRTLWLMAKNLRWWRWIGIKR